MVLTLRGALPTVLLTLLTVLIALLTPLNLESVSAANERDDDIVVVSVIVLTAANK